jgi:hypothetical protein
VHSLTSIQYSMLPPLQETATLPSVKNTRQSSKNTRQSLCRVLHSAKDTRKRNCRHRALCRVHFVGHSAKPLPSAKCRTRQNLSAVTEQARNGRFAECQGPRTRQIFLLCRVQTLGKDCSDFAECRHSAKILQILPSANTQQSAQNYPF